VAKETGKLCAICVISGWRDKQDLRDLRDQWLKETGQICVICVISG
jgi:hypothetical protein